MGWGCCVSFRQLRTCRRLGLGSDWPLPTMVPLSDAREIGVTFNRELPTGRAELL
jgi:hypothetical protein